jgi:hypothetical protein
MEFNRRDLRCSDETFHAIDLNITFAIALYVNDGNQVRHPAHLVTLEKSLAVDAIRSPDDRTGSSSNVLDHPRADNFQVVRKVALGVVVRRRPEGLGWL